MIRLVQYVFQCVSVHTGGGGNRNVTDQCMESAGVKLRMRDDLMVEH